MKQPYIAYRPFRYNILVNDEWQPWSGAFGSKKDALVWHRKHGVFHEARGHVIALFNNKVKVK